DENRMEQGSAHKLVIVRVSHYLRGILGFIEGDTTEDVGLRVANSHTSNHRGDNFTSLETIRRFLKLGVDPFRARRGGLRARGEGPVGNWITLSNRSGPDIPRAITKPITHIEGWKGSFFYIKNKIVPSEYAELILEDNKLDKKSFKDVIPQHDREDPLYNQISTYPANVRTFSNPIQYLAEMDFRSFMMEGIDGEFHFEPEGGVGDDEGSSPSTRSVDNETSVNDAEPLIFIPPSQFTENTVESDDPSLEKDEVPPQASKAAGDSSDPLDVDSDPDIQELKDSADYHWVVAHVVLDNVMNRRARELMSTLMKARASCDDIQER
ncbi:hypothetical protein Tco_1181359, partial [Tanacetum coccineum]